MLFVDKYSCLIRSCRCRIGHTRTTYSYIFEGEPPSECIPCQFQHILNNHLLGFVDNIHIIVGTTVSDINKELFTNVASEKL